MHTVILGAGPGGYTAALVAAQKGMEVTLIEQKAVGGTCLNRGCIPTKALLASGELYDKIKQAAKFGISVQDVRADLSAIMERKNKVVSTMKTSLEGLLKKRGVKIISASGKLGENLTVTTDSETFKADNIILATGSEAARIWTGEHIITSDEALNLSDLPNSMLIIGAGAVGLEFGCFFAQLGTKVTVIEMLDQILPAIDKEITDTLSRELKKKGITIKTSCRAEEIDGKKVRFSDGKEGTFDLILQAVGRKFNTENIGLEEVGISLEKGRIRTNSHMETQVKHIYAIGDIAYGSPLLAHSASAQGITAARHIAGENAHFTAELIPGCIYTHPEVASVGLSAQALENPLTGSIPYRVMGRAHASGEIAGILKVIADRQTREIKGVHIIGERATDLVHEGLTAIKMHATIENMGDIIRAHPTYSELYSEAYHLMEGRPIHVL